MMNMDAIRMTFVKAGERAPGKRSALMQNPAKLSELRQRLEANQTSVRGDCGVEKCHSHGENDHRRNANKHGALQESGVDIAIMRDLVRYCGPGQQEAIDQNAQ